MIEYTVKVCKDYTQWFINGKTHRDDGPALEWSSGTKLWYKNGELHREDGPAVEYSSGEKEWYLNGTRYTEEEYNRKMNPVKELTVEEISKLLGYDVKIIKG
jgi:hypothetical protein